MIKLSKRKLIILVFIIILLTIFISINFILIKFYIHKKHPKRSLVQNITNLKEKVNISYFNTPNYIANIYEDYNWRIQIPKLKLNAPILEGTDLKILRQAVGHFSNTGKSSGNICLAAHNRGYKYNFFQEIKNLQIGDEIIYSVNGNKKTFKVSVNKTIKEYDLSVLENTKETRLTLITCEENKKEYRRCIIAEEIL